MIQLKLLHHLKTLWCLLNATTLKSILFSTITRSSKTWPLPFLLFSFSFLYSSWDPKLQQYGIPYIFSMGYNPFFVHATNILPITITLILHRNSSCSPTRSIQPSTSRKHSSSSILIRTPPTFSYKILVVTLCLPHFSLSINPLRAGTISYYYYISDLQSLIHRNPSINAFK